MCPSLISRTYILLTVILTVFVITFGYYDANETKRRMLTKKEFELMRIVVVLDQKFPKIVEQGLIAANLQGTSHKEQIAQFNETLQLALNDVNTMFPGYGLGYGGKQMLATYPPKPDILEMPVAELVRRAIENKQVMIGYNPSAHMWDGASTLTVINPHIENGEMIGFSWANSKVEEIEKAFLMVLWRNIVVFFVLWLLLMLVLRWSFKNIDRELHRFNDYLKQQGADIAQPSLAFNEMAETLDTVCELRRKLQDKSQEMEERERHFEACMDNMLDRTVILEPVQNEQGRIIDFEVCFVNKALCTAHQKQKEDFIGLRMLEVWPGLTESSIEMYRRVYETGVAIERDTFNYHDSNGRIDGVYERQAVKVRNGIAVTVRDITEQNKSEERFLKAFHINPNIMYVISVERDCYIDVNESFAEAAGRKRDEIQGIAVNGINLWCSLEERTHVRNILARQGRIHNYEIRYRYRTGEVRNALLSVETITILEQQCYLCVMTDVTDKKRLDTELARLDCLNVVGEMAAGIGHEVRNPMTTVRGYLQVMQMKKEFGKHRDTFGIMIEELDRANTIITDFLSLAKDKGVELKYGNINTIILSLQPLLEADAFRRGHQLYAELNLIPDNKFDDKELRQLILNLVRNGFEAMEESGKVVIRTFFQDDSVVLEIQDTGPGIPPDVMAKLGTPFMTTKESGTGLGIPVCFRIAEHHGAKIAIETGRQGTTFRVSFSLST